MFLNSKINTKEEFEKYLFLLELDDLKLNELNSVINCFQNNERNYYELIIKYENIVDNSDSFLEIHKLRDIKSKEDIKFFSDTINAEILKNKKFLNHIKSILNNNSILLIDTFKENLNKGKILTKEDINKLKNITNKEKIKDIIDKIEETEKSIFNKEDRKRRIIMLERKIINEMETLLNKLCFIINIDYKNKDIKTKYYSITNLLRKKNEAYLFLNEFLNDKISLLDKIDNLNLNLDFDDIRKISIDGVRFLLEKLRLYEMNKKDNRVKVSFMVR